VDLRADTTSLFVDELAADVVAGLDWSAALMRCEEFAAANDRASI
jgi:hypothetical protein